MPSGEVGYQPIDARTTKQATLPDEDPFQGHANPVLCEKHQGPMPACDAPKKKNRPRPRRPLKRRKKTPPRHESHSVQVPNSPTCEVLVIHPDKGEERGRGGGSHWSFSQFGVQMRMK